jgi:hypothetical protein
MRIKVMTTGWSVDKTYSTRVSAFVVGEPQIAGILSEANVGFDSEVESSPRKDSSTVVHDHGQMTISCFPDWIRV